MSCHRIYDRDQLNKIFGKSLKNYNEHLKEVLYNRQKAKLPLFFNHAKKIKQEKAYTEEFEKIKAQLSHQAGCYHREIKELKRKKTQTDADKVKIRELMNKIDAINGEYTKSRTLSKKISMGRRIQVLQKPPSDIPLIIAECQKKIETNKAKIVEYQKHLDEHKKNPNYFKNKPGLYLYHCEWSIARHRRNIKLAKEDIKNLEFLTSSTPEEKAEFKALYDEICKIYRTAYDLFNKNVESLICPKKYPKPETDKQIQSKPKKIYIKACTQSGCHGFLDETWTCAVCSQKVCSKCFEDINDDAHLCKEENILSAKLIKTQTKPCPKCSAPVLRASGCTQMMCTNNNCNTVFDFKTGEIDKGVIHNPHFYHWRMESGNGDDKTLNYFQCGRRFPHFGMFKRRIAQVFGLKTNEEFTKFVNKNKKELSIIKFLHLTSTTFTGRMKTIQVTFNTDLKHKYRSLSIKYINHEITKKQFKETLYKYHNSIKANNAFMQLYDMFNNIAREIIIKLFNEPKKVHSYSKELIKLVVFINKQLIEKSIIYSRSVYLINRNGTLSKLQKFNQKKYNEMLNKLSSSSSGGGGSSGSSSAHS
jgi:hypothetical protein